MSKLKLVDMVNVNTYCRECGDSMVVLLKKGVLPLGLICEKCADRRRLREQAAKVKKYIMKGSGR